MADTNTTIVLAPPTDPEPAAAEPVTTLGTLPAPDGHPHLVLLTETGTPAVVLTHHRSSVDLLHADGTVTTVPAHTPATTITDPARQCALLRAAVSYFRTSLTETRAARSTTDVQHQQVLDNIRRYSIDRHRNSDICRRGLDEFLNAFDMDPYLPPLQIKFTINGSYVVHDSTADTAEYDGTNLTVDFSAIDNLVHDSTGFHVTIDAVEDADRELY